MADLSQFSTADLEAIANGKLSSVSDAGLQLLHDSASSQSDSAPSMFAGATKSAIDSLPMIGGIAGGILGTPADAVSGPMGNIVGAGIGGYLGTATKNLINRYYDPDSAPQTTTQALIQPVTGGVEQALMQGVGEAATPYATKGLQAAANAGSSAVKWGATKLLSNLGGVSPDVIKEYAQFSNRINAAPSVDALKDVSDQFVGKLADDVNSSKLTADQAQDVFKGFQSDLKDAYKTAGYDARDAVTSAQQTLKDAHNARLQQLSGDVYDSVNQLKSDIQSGSATALKTLDRAQGKVDLAPVYSQIDQTVDQLNKAGTDEALAVADRLGAYRQRLSDNHGNAIFAPDAKRLIQGLDKITDYSPMAGTFDKAKNAAFKGIRGVLDDQVKTAVPEYASAMEPVAADSDLLSRVQGFGDKQSGVGLLQRINAPNQLDNRVALQQLGQKYGTDFVAGAQPENLPEYAQLQKAQGIRDALRPDRVADKIDQTVNASRQKAAVDAAQNNLTSAQEQLAPFKSLAPNSAGQTQAQQKLAQLAKPDAGPAAQVGKGSNIELVDMFQQLGKLTNTDFIQAMKDHNTLAAFQKGATNGSRNTLIGALAGWAFGGPEGGVIGAGTGRGVDQWGPAITKKVLNGAISVSRNPTVSAIANLELPEAVKRNMVVGLENYFSKGASPSVLPNVAQNQGQPNRTPAIQNKNQVGN